MEPFTDASVAAKFTAYPQPVRQSLLALRELIFATAQAKPAIGAITETLKWDQPSYLTNQTKSGSTIRLDTCKAHPEGFALYFHCQTSLVETFRTTFGSRFHYEGNRALLFNARDSLPETELRQCIDMALTYHLRKRTHHRPLGERIQRSLKAKDVIP